MSPGLGSSKSARPFECSICAPPSSFPSFAKLEEHQSADVHSVRSDSQPLSRRGLECPECDQQSQFSSSSALQSHWNTYHAKFAIVELPDGQSEFGHREMDSRPSADDLYRLVFDSVLCPQGEGGVPLPVRALWSTHYQCPQAHSNPLQGRRLQPRRALAVPHPVELEDRQARRDARLAQTSPRTPSRSTSKESAGRRRAQATCRSASKESSRDARSRTTFHHERLVRPHNRHARRWPFLDRGTPAQALD